MTEPLALLVTVAATSVLLRPLLDRIRTPSWYERARQRGRPGVPVTVALSAAVLMTIAWMIGERRGVGGVILLLVWIGAPLTTWRVVRAWYLPKRRPPEASVK